MIQSRTEGLSDDEKPKVYVEFPWTYKCPTAWLPCDFAGGRNICADLPGIKVDPEWVMEQNPDIIVKIENVHGGRVGYDLDDPSGIIALREEIMNRPELANVKAVKTGRVYVIEVDYLTVGPNLITGTAYCAKWFHPELFEDFDPKEIHQEYLDRFQGLDFDVSEHGIFVYHPELYPDGR